MEEYPKPEQHWFDADKNSGSEPSKKTKKKQSISTSCEKCNNDLKVYNENLEDVISKTDKLIKKLSEKKQTGILKDLLELKRLYINNDHGDVDMIESEIGAFVEWSDVEAIINKYLNP